jgi:hypothetical protein
VGDEYAARLLDSERSSYPRRETRHWHVVAEEDLDKWETSTLGTCSTRRDRATPWLDSRQRTIYNAHTD